MATILTKSTVYLGKNLFGIASKVVAPAVEMETTEIKHGLGSYNLNTAFKPMTASITLQGFDIDVFNKIANPFQEVNFTIYGALERYENENLASCKQAKLVIRGASNKFPLLGELEQQSNISYEMTFNVTMAKLDIDKKEKYLIDNANYVYRKDGVDHLASIRKALALE